MTVKQLRVEWLKLKGIAIKNGKTMGYHYSPVLKSEYQMCLLECIEILQGEK